MAVTKIKKEINEREKIEKRFHADSGKRTCAERLDSRQQIKDDALTDCACEADNV